MPKVLGIVLAGGEGKRLMPLTLDRAKPAVPFGGSYRLIDFALSNLVNAGYLQCAVLTQYKSHSLDRHISVTWRMSTLLGNYVTPVPAQQRRGPQWYLGSADAIYQSMNLINDARPDIIVVFGADHVYRMDASQMVQAHVETGAGVTVAGIRVPRKEAWQFGVIKTAADGVTIDEFLEKPADPPGLVDSPDESFASMGNYVFSADVLVDALEKDADEPGLAPRHGRRHHPDDGGGAAGVRLRLQAQRRARRDGPRPRLLARRGDARLLPRGAPRPGLGRADLQPLQHRLADLHLAPAAPGREVRRGRHGPRHHRVRRLDRLRRQRRQLGDRQQRVRRGGCEGRAQRSSTTSRSAAGP